jgi:opacity protein-like surface antigen
MKKILLILVVIAIATCLSFAGDPNVKAGDKALMFSIKGFGEFGVGGLGMPAFETGENDPAQVTLYGFGMKYFLADNIALRGIFDFAYESHEIPENKTVSTTFFGFVPGLEYHIVNTNSVTAYLGGAIAFEMSKETSKPVLGDETSNSGTIIGVAGLMGAEFFPWDNVSLGAEYMLGFSSQTTTETDTEGKDTDGDSWTKFGIQSAAVTLSIYF